MKTTALMFIAIFALVSPCHAQKKPGRTDQKYNNDERIHHLEFKMEVFDWIIENATSAIWKDEAMQLKEKLQEVFDYCEGTLRVGSGCANEIAKFYEDHGKMVAELEKQKRVAEEAAKKDAEKKPKSTTAPVTKSN